MSSKRSTFFRPTVQTLETRRCMAAAVGEFVAPTEGTDETAIIATVTDTTISGNTANREGGGLWNSDTDDLARAGVFPSENHDGAPINNDGTPDIITGAGPGGGPHVRVFSGATGSPLPAADDSTDTGGGVHEFSFQVGSTIFVDKKPPPADAADAFFSDLGRDDGASNIIGVLVGL